MILAHRLYYWTVVMLIGFGTIGIISCSYLPDRLEGYTQPVADQTVWAAFYAGIFLCLLGFSNLVGYGIRWLPKHALSTPLHSHILRQSTLIAVGLTVLVILQGYQVLSWWDSLLLIIALLLVELSFQTRSLQ